MIAQLFDFFGGFGLLVISLIVAGYTVAGFYTALWLASSLTDPFGVVALVAAPVWPLAWVVLGIIEFIIINSFPEEEKNGKYITTIQQRELPGNIIRRRDKNTIYSRQLIQSFVSRNNRCKH
jgi:hypothetical protein